MESIVMGLDECISFDFGLKCGNINKEMLSDYPLVLPYLTLFYVEVGTAVVSIDFKEYTLHKGNFIVVGEDNIVSFKNVSVDLKIYSYLIQRDYASEIAYILPNELFGYLHYYPVLYLNNETIVNYELWKSFTMYIMTSTSLHTKRIICNQFQSLFLLLSERVNYEELVLEKHYSRQEELCWTFWDLITHNAKIHRDVAFYADKLFISPYYLSQITQQFLRYSPKELINRQVILEIKHYLNNTDLNISQIAEQLNFPDPSYMGRFFKRETGKNPLQFRR
ncbi:helix-turn-helix domain-containing protein [Myroides sp. M-43]|uniref:helix-turn-helix domain-containing protein n=1 Tax=Myroides oncorhynchi TaxID=2893756 RepID=UPI001E4BB852|nr:helix-turn-helix domain-containing protein [Myroides oncorhynchi]MCC9042768.1 helix-turn-helix domain-containing protein [Myroides oncorhynchi]